VLGTSGAVTLVILLVFLMIRAVSFLRDAAAGIVPVERVLALIFLKLLTFIDVLIPLVLFIAVIMVLNRWRKDNELVAILASGIGMRSFLRPALKLAIVIGAVIAGFSFYIAPMSVRMSHEIIKAFKEKNDITGVIPGIFMETRHGKGVYFVEIFDEAANVYRNVFIYDSSPEQDGVVIADVGFQRNDELTNDTFLVLKNGTRYEGRPGDPNYRVVDFETYATRIRPRSRIGSIPPLSGRSMAELQTSKGRYEAAEWHWRFAKLASLPALLLFALSVNIPGRRGGQVVSGLLAFGFYFAYANSLGFGVVYVRKGILNPTVGLWVIHAVFLLIAIYVFVRRTNDRSLIPFRR